MRSLACAALVLAASCLVSPTHAEEPPAPLRFDWPVPGKVTVTEKVTRGGRSGTTRYTVSLSRAEGGDGLRAHIGDMEVLELLGHPASDSAVAPFVTLFRAISAAVPDLLISKEGRLTDIAAIDTAIDAAFAGVESGASPQQKQAIAAARAELAKPQARELMVRQAHGFWDAWVGDWVGLKLAEGTPFDTTHALRGPDDTLIDAPARITRKRVDGGRVELERKTTLEGEQARAALESYVRKMTQLTGSAPPEGTFVGLEAQETVRVTTDPATLRPTAALVEWKASLHRRGSTDDKTERREYSFAW